MLANFTFFFTKHPPLSMCTIDSTAVSLIYNEFNCCVLFKMSLMAFTGTINCISLLLLDPFWEFTTALAISGDMGWKRQILTDL